MSRSPRPWPSIAVPLGVLLAGPLWLIVEARGGPLEEGLAALRSGQADAAELLLEEAVAREPGAVQAWWELGWAHYAQDELESAVSSWERVESLDPTWPELDHWLGLARVRAGLAANGAASALVELVAEGDGLTLAAAGDTMMGSELRKGAAGLAPGSGERLFTGVSGWLCASDVAFLNLEGPLADGLPSTKCPPGSSNCYAFRTPTRYVAALQDLGLDVASLANNHAMDLGVPGQDATMATLDAAGIAHAGRYGDVAWLERDGLRIAVLAAHSGSCCLNVNRIEEVVAAIQAADQEADLVVLSFHGGGEGSAHRHVPGEVERAWGEYRGDVKALARAAVDAGADLVLGHGPHVLRAMEVYRGRLIAYSLGNFCGYKQFGTQGGHGGTSVVLEAELAGNGVFLGGRLHPVMLDSSGRPRPDPEGRAWASVAELSAADFPETGIWLDPQGEIAWARPKGGSK